MNDSIRSERPSMLSQGEIFTSKCITNMNTSSPLKRILNNLTIQIIFEYFMDIYNKLFPYSNIHPTFVLYVLLSKQMDIQTHTFQI